MTVKIACPVCDRPGVMEDICPNCETDLTLIRGLMDLPAAISPVQTPMVQEKSTVPPWLILTAIAFLAMGILLGGVGAYWPAQNKISQLQNQIDQTESNQTITPSLPPKICNRGFEYVVRQGDSLSLIALRFYGDAEQQKLIIQENPSLKGKEDFLEIGDKLLIPTLNNECL
jgi:hypothetical protein